ncbi:bifunctional indole-3-glycerol-phosphate synthase TrpC/phosphoribosylanthranilate isomerase TrpF [Sphingomonas edaphi]|uniref:N-(5'-phosphoribosyl)anthranilate isomerase n=1 Tax=Sphingomonas edaphi TaxID=2315689 RepID=A0A418PYI5_9SPHN|nr:bifunctional indole-3-glycerol-phosphate synthase TrpC/phosphoribosylanthranilate isomerase TrpF [Sphingomonas edaphi]RIX27103.1 bifunctional indole-3-glycerol-phosphate synthase TrpC/phosphoribosylanthranilate isomerase TrpF [Sphingomonas edaphi]
MADVLARIVARKRTEVAARIAEPIAAEPTRRSLRAALAKPGARFIMEVKRRSPSGHAARHSLENAVRAYAPVADAISVLTDEADFGGSLEDLRAVRARFDGPILAKDFVVHPSQVREARAAGADAVLAMMSVLDDHEAAAVMHEARELGMDIIVEVHDEDELARALALGADIVGINNRDLTSLSIDLSVTEGLAPKVPDNVLVIAESGISGRSDVTRLAPYVDAFLVGSALMAADDIGRATRSLVHGQVKICGLTRVEDIAEAARLGATDVGFIFHAASPRRTTAEQARILIGAARNAGLRSVGVFSGDDPHIADTARLLGLDAVQVHGSVDPTLTTSLAGRDLIGVCAIRDGITDPPPACSDRLLFDSGDGGTGQSFDWGVIDGHPALATAFLAGGINPANVAAAAQVGAAGIDLSSGIETAPGIKDHDKMAALFAALRPAARSDT